MNAYIKEMQERYQIQIRELLERLDESDPPRKVITETERGQMAERMEREMTCSSWAALLTITNNAKEVSDNGMYEEYYQEGEVSEERFEEEVKEKEIDNETNGDK